MKEEYFSAHPSHEKAIIRAFLTRPRRSRLLLISTIAAVCSILLSAASDAASQEPLRPQLPPVDGIALYLESHGIIEAQELCVCACLDELGRHLNDDVLTSAGELGLGLISKTACDLLETSLNTEPTAPMTIQTLLDPTVIYRKTEWVPCSGYTEEDIIGTSGEPRPARELPPPRIGRYDCESVPFP